MTLQVADARFGASELAAEWGLVADMLRECECPEMKPSYCPLCGEQDGVTDGTTVYGAAGHGYKGRSA